MEKVVNAILSSRQTLLLLLGVCFVVLAIAGGVTYEQWLPMPGKMERLLAGFSGFVLVGLSFLRPQTDGLSEEQIRSFGITIRSPIEGTEVSGKTHVNGDYKKKWPNNYELVLLRGYPQGGFVPNSAVTCDPEKKSWMAQDFDIGGASGNARRIEAWLIGQDGRVLLDNWAENHKVVRDLNDAVGSGEKAQWLPPIKAPTKDMHRCAWVSVKRTKT